MSQEATINEEVGTGTVAPEQLTPVFEEANNIVSEYKIGRLSVRDSVLLAKAIDTVRPGSI